MRNLHYIFLFFIFYSFLLTQSNAQAPEIQWQKCLGGSGDDESYSLSKSLDGGFYISGYSTSLDGDVSGNHGSYDYWIVKLDSLGNIEWEKSFGGSQADYAYTSAITADSGCIIGGSTASDNGDISENYGNGDDWILKLSSAGDIEWEKNYGGTSNDEAATINQTNEGYFVGGTSNSNDYDVSGINGGSDSWVFEINFEGEIIWQNALGGSDAEGAKSIDRTNDGGYIIANGTFSNDGDVSGNHGSTDIWITKLNSEGILQWQKCFGGSDAEEVYSIKATIDGGILCTSGYANSIDGDVIGHHGITENSDAWLIKLDSLGNLLWQKCLGGSKGDAAYCVNETSDNGLIIAGATVSNDGDVSGHHEGVEINTDYWIVKLDSTGSIEWQKCLGGFNHDRAYYAAETNDGGYIITGLTNSADGDVTGNHGSYDYWVVKLAPPCPKDTFYADTDGDGFGDLLNDSLACELPTGFVSDSTDCNDTMTAIHPTAKDICNSIDDNCNGEIDENATFEWWFSDADHDDFGNAEIDSLSCFTVEGYVPDSSDCDDTNPNIYPGATEILNGLDDDCDGLTDEGLSINEIILNSIHIYPNPTKDILHIDYDGNDKVEIEIINITGQILQTIKLIPISTEINVGLFATGVYILKIQTADDEVRISFVKE